MESYTTISVKPKTKRKIKKLKDQETYTEYLDQLIEEIWEESEKELEEEEN